MVTSISICPSVAGESIEIDALLPGGELTAGYALCSGIGICLRSRLGGHLAGVKVQAADLDDDGLLDIAAYTGDILVHF